MSRIDPNAFRNWNDGEVMYSDDYEREREIIRTAINDNFDRLIKRFEILQSNGSVKATQNLDTAVNYLKFKEGDSIVMALDGAGTLKIAVVDGGISTQKLADLSVTTQKIADGAVTVLKLADGSVSTQKLMDLAVTTAKIADGAVTDAKIGNRTISDSTAPSGDSGLLSTLLGWIAHMIKAITGKANWRTMPDVNLSQVKAHMDDRNNPHGVTAAQIGAITSVDGVENPGGNIDLVPGTGIIIVPDNASKTITFYATGESVPGPHAATHAAGGPDEIRPEMIGAETPAGAQAKVDAHEAKSDPHPQYVKNTGGSMTGPLYAPDVKWGVGRTILLPNGTDLNTITDSGWYEVQNPANAPIGTQWAWIQHIRHTADEKWSVQYIYNFHDLNEIYIRRSYNNGGVREWTPWQKVWHGGHFNANDIFKRVNAPVTRDMNDFVELNAFFTWDTGVGDFSNTPLGYLPQGSAQVFVVKNYGFNPDRIQQECSFIFNQYNVRIFRRNREDTTWGPWYEVWHSGSQLKAEVVSSFPAHADGRIIYHTGDQKFYGSAAGKWV